MFRSLRIAVLLAFAPAVEAGIIEVPLTQAGGFYIDSANNTAAFQNYFVGYGTTPGFPRTSERRSFFWFDIPSIPGTITDATLHLALPFGGLIFGIADGPVPPPGTPPVKDLSESFQLSATALSPMFLTRTDLTLAENAMIFASLKGPATAGSVDFPLSGDLPPGATATPYGMNVAIPLNDAGKFFLGLSEGTPFVLSGWMPSWSHDERLAPPGSPVLYYEASELIFGLTDVGSGAFPSPKLVITFDSTAAVPEPGIVLPATVALALGILRRRRRTGPKSVLDTSPTRQ